MTKEQLNMIFEIYKQRIPSAHASVHPKAFEGKAQEAIEIVRILLDTIDKEAGKERKQDNENS